MMVKTKNQGDDGSSLFLDWGIYYKNEQDPLLSRKDEKLMGSKMKKKDLPRVRLELTAFRLWDWRAANCATEAL